MNAHPGPIAPDDELDAAVEFQLAELLRHVSQDLATAIRLSAIPHRFNQEIIATLRSDELPPSPSSIDILARISTLPFVAPCHTLGYAYHNKIRATLLQQWSADPEAFRQHSRRMAAYWEEKMAKVRGQEYRHFEREWVYHLLVSDEQRGWNTYTRLLQWAMNYEHLSTCALLIGYANEQRPYLTKARQLALDAHDAMLVARNGHVAEAKEQLQTVLDRNSLGALRSHLLTAMAQVLEWTGDSAQSVRLLRESIDLFRGAQDPSSELETMSMLAGVYCGRNMWMEAEDLYQTCLARYRSQRDLTGEIKTLDYLGSVWFLQGKPADALSAFSSALELCRGGANPVFEYQTHIEIGKLHLYCGTRREALDHLAKGLRIARSLGDVLGESWALDAWGHLFYLSGQMEKAEALYLSSLAVRREYGFLHNQAFTLAHLGRLYLRQGRLKDCFAVLRSALSTFRKFDDKAGEVRVLSRLTLAYVRARRFRRAQVSLRRTRRALRQLSNRLQGPGSTRLHVVSHLAGGMYGLALRGLVGGIRWPRRLTPYLSSSRFEPGYPMPEDSDVHSTNRDKK